jgi:chromate reductase
MAVEKAMSNDTKPIKVLGISGSLRKASYNTMLLHNAVAMLPPGMSVEIFDLAAIPLYNEDVREKGFPAPVQQLRDKIAQSDALLIATPEYNYSIPGVLKNAIDWASRPPDQPFIGKPVAIMGVTPSTGRTIRSQLHLRQCFVFLNMHPVNKPEVLISDAARIFDEQGRLTDDTTRGFVRDLMAALAVWTRTVRGD